MDFAALRSVGSRKWLSLSMDEILRTELLEHRAIGREELLPQELQPFLSELMQLADVDSGLPEPLLRKIAHILPGLRADQPAPELPKARTETLVGLLNKQLRPEIISDLRNGRLEGDAKLCLVEDIAFRSYRSEREARGAKPLPWPTSMVTRVMILKVWRALSWLQLGGLDAAAGEKLRNDAYDDEYVLVGSYFDGLLSAENRVQEADAALRRTVDSASSESLLAAYFRYSDIRPTRDPAGC